MHSHLLSLIAVVGLGVAPAQAMNEFEGPLKELAAGELAGWITEPAVIAAVMAQNAANADLTQGDIDGLDADWRAQVGSAPAAMIDTVMNTPVSVWLRERQQAAAGLVTEVFFMDNRGLNVAQSNITSDYWQGDEDKWQQTYSAGPGAVLISDVEFDESSQTYQSQVSMTVIDPATGAAIGAVTFGIDVGMLQ